MLPCHGFGLGFRHPGLHPFVDGLRGHMRELEQRMTVRLGAMIAAAVGIIVAPDKPL